VYVVATPIITVQPQSGVFKNNDRNVMVFEVVATGMGPISYQWEKYQSFNNNWISPSGRAVSVTTPKLIFSMITEEDEGTYHCIVTNDDGSVVSDNVNITVHGELHNCKHQHRSISRIIFNKCFLGFDLIKSMSKSMWKQLLMCHFVYKAVYAYCQGIHITGNKWKIFL